MESQFIKELKNCEKDLNKDLNNDVKYFLIRVAKHGEYLQKDGSELDSIIALIDHFYYLNRIIDLLGGDLVCRFITNIESENDIQDCNDRKVYEKSNLLIRFGQLLKNYGEE